MRNVFSASILIIMFLFINSCAEKTDNEGTVDEPFDKVVTAIMAENDNLWVGTDEDGLYMFDGISWTVFKYPESLVSNCISALEINNDGVLYVATDMGISSLENGIWTSITTDDGLFSNKIYCLDCDDDNIMWIGTRNNRLVKYSDGNFTTYHVNPEASGPGELGHIHTIFHDPEGNIWVGSCISGLSKFDGEEWTHNINDISVFAMFSLSCNNGDLWIGCPTGLYSYSGGVWKRYTQTEGLPCNNVACIAEDSNHNIWIGTEMGLSKFDGQDFTSYTTADGLLDNYIMAIAFDNKGDTWIGSLGGLQKFYY